MINLALLLLGIAGAPVAPPSTETVPIHWVVDEESGELVWVSGPGPVEALPPSPTTGALAESNFSQSISTFPVPAFSCAQVPSRWENFLATWNADPALNQFTAPVYAIGHQLAYRSGFNLSGRPYSIHFYEKYAGGVSSTRTLVSNQTMPHPSGAVRLASGAGAGWNTVLYLPWALQAEWVANPPLQALVHLQILAPWGSNQYLHYCSFMVFSPRRPSGVTFVGNGFNYESGVFDPPDDSTFVGNGVGAVVQAGEDLSAGNSRLISEMGSNATVSASASGGTSSKSGCLVDPSAKLSISIVLWMLFGIIFSAFLRRQSRSNSLL